MWDLDNQPEILVIILFYYGVTDADVQFLAAQALFKATHLALVMK